MLPKDWGNGWDNVCLMTSVEDQKRANRVSILAGIPAKYRGLSMEPLLEAVYFGQDQTMLRKINFIIVGGETGSRARPMHPGWVQAIRSQCEDADLQFFFKQWGQWGPDKTLMKQDAQNVVMFEEPWSEPVFLGGMPKEQRFAALKNSQDFTLLFKADKKLTGSKLDGTLHRAHPFNQPVKKSVTPAANSKNLLSDEERKQLTECEQTIRNGIGAFVAVGNALLKIRDARLYREKFQTFEDYLQMSMALSRPRAYELMNGARVMADLSGIPDISLPLNEAQANELTRFKTPEARRENWKKVLAAQKQKPLTAKFIREILAPKKARDLNPDAKITQAKSALARMRLLLEGTQIKKEAEALIGKLEKLLNRARIG